MNKFKEKVTHIMKKDPIFLATFWMFVATGFLNVGNYLYHLLMIILIKSPRVFGELESAIALLYIFYVPLQAVSLVIVKYISEQKGKGNTNKINALYGFFNKCLLIFGISVSLIIITFSSSISNLFHFSSIIIAVLLAFTFMTSLLSNLIRSVLQGVTNFFSLAIINFFEVTSKIVISVMLIFAGYNAIGGLIGFALSGLIGYCVGLFFIRKSHIATMHEKIDYKPIIKYGIPVLLTILATTSFITSDILLVRRFFSGEESGYYSFLSLVGKIIFFAVTPITLVMFPLVSEAKARGGKHSHLLLFSIVGMMTIMVPLVFFYFLYPEIIISLFLRKDYLIVAPQLGMIAVFFALYSCNVLFANYYLSLQKNKASFFVILFAVLQILLIYLFHESLAQVIQMSVISSFVLLISLLLYYPYAKN